MPRFHQISEKKLVPIVLDMLKEDMGQHDISFERLAPAADHKAIELLQLQLDQISLKETRIKEAYRNGIDTLDEYKENKELYEENVWIWKIGSGIWKFRKSNVRLR